MKQLTRISLLILGLVPAMVYSQLYAELNYAKNPTCFGLNNGSASVSVSGGTAPYHFTWTPVNADTNTITNLCSGSYHVTITDNGGSTPVSLSFTLSAPAKLVGNATLGASSCQGTEITISATGGTAPYYSGGNTLYYDADTFYNNPAGNYVFVVTDYNGCTDTVPVSVNYAPNFQVSILADTACANGTAKVTVRAIGASGSFYGVGTFYRGAGVQTFQVQDSVSGCVIVDSVNVPTFPSTAVTIAPPAAMMCSNDSVMIRTTSNFGSYAWNNGDTTSYIYAKQAGAYYVTITDNNKCHVESNHVHVTTFDAPMVSVTLRGDTIIAYTSGTYQWLYNSEPIAGATQSEFVAKEGGEYSVSVTDSNGCKAVSTQLDVTVTGVKEVADVKVGVYPNPSPQGIFQVTVASEMIGGQLLIYNSNGQVIQQSEIEQTTNSVAITSAPGMYIAAIVTPAGTFYKKLVKN